MNFPWSTSNNSTGAPMAAGTIVLAALVVLVFFNRNLRSVTASVAVGAS